jgi:hypothetical protein
MLSCSDAGVQKKLDEQGAEIQVLKAELESLKLDEKLRKLDQIAILSTSEKGYSAISTDLGVITVTLDDVQPYATGSKVILRFGNLTSASFTDPKAKIDWGPVDEKGYPDNAKAKTKDLDFIKPLPPGEWTSFDVILDGVSPSSLGFVRVHDFTNDRIGLRH